MGKNKFIEQQSDFLEDYNITEDRIKIAKKFLISKGYFVANTIEDVKQILIDNGYKVSDPLIVDEKIVNMKDLLNYFYKRLYDRYPEKKFEYFLDTLPSDLRMIKYFVLSREKTGLNRKAAIQECVSIIDVIFDYEKEFGFKEPIDINVLGQKKSSWITEKAIFILNSKLNKQKESISEGFREEIEENIGINLEKRSEELSAILKKMGGNN